MFCHPIPNTTTTNMSYPKGTKPFIFATSLSSDFIAINLVKQFIYQSTKDGVSDTRHQKVPILRTIDNDNILNSSIKKNAIAMFVSILFIFCYQHLTYQRSETLQNKNGCAIHCI